MGPLVHRLANRLEKMNYLTAAAWDSKVNLRILNTIMNRRVTG